MNPGGLLEDKDNGNCYGWLCVGELRDAGNSDSINMLAIAMKVWELKYFIDTDGYLQKRDIE
ncbi:hypothetical protein KJ359_006236 [Pestalotiopsis sp. 9143b]|nr:hypothetical protein KJ359_006236 [Pestalotiopsis sp. 9143b]